MVFFGNYELKVILAAPFTTLTDMLKKRKLSNVKQIHGIGINPLNFLCPAKKYISTHIFQGLKKSERFQESFSTRL